MNSLPNKLPTSIRSLLPRFIFVFEKEWVAFHSKWILAGLSLLAFLVIRYMFSYYSDIVFQDKSGSWAIANNLVEGKGYSACASNYFPFCSPDNQATAMREPMPVFLMVIATLIHPSTSSGMTAQAILFFATMLAIYMSFRKYDQRVAILAAFIWVVSKPVFAEIGDDTGELTSALFLALGFLFFIRGMDAPNNKRDWILSGLFMGLSALSRTVLLGTSLILGFSLLIISIYNKTQRPLLKPSFIFLTTFLLVYSPWAIRNYVVFGTPMMGSTLTGYNIYRMNRLVMEELFTPHYVGSDEGHQTLTQLIDSSYLTGTENEAQMQSVYMKAGLKIISEHPVQYAELVMYRFLPLWFNSSVDAAYGNKLSVFDYLAMIQQSLLLVAVIIGAFRNWKRLWPFILVLIAGCGAYMAVDAQLRYLVDLMPALAIISASSLVKLKS